MAWDELSGVAGEKNFSVRFSADIYDVNLTNRTILSSSANTPAKEYLGIIILHYLIKKIELKVLPEPSGEWVDFRALEGGEGYYPAFKKRTIDVILKKYGDMPDRLLESARRFGGKPASIGDTGIIMDIFEKVPMLITFWKGDEEFAPEANISFDKGISGIFCTEDIVVMTEVVAHSL